MRYAILLAMVCLFQAPQTLAEPVLWSEDEGGDGYYYEFVPETLTWHEAKLAASKRVHHGVPGRLIVIKSQAQNDFAHSLLPDDQTRAWLGLTDEVKEGVFLWIDGTKPSYTNWNPGEPNNADGDEHYGEMHPNGKWNDKEGAPAEGQPGPTGYFVEYYAEHLLADAPPRRPSLMESLAWQSGSVTRVWPRPLPNPPQTHRTARQPRRATPPRVV